MRCRAAIAPVFSVNYSFSSGGEITVFAVGAYTGPLIRLVLGKARGDRIAALELGDLIAHSLIQLAEKPEILLPVPMHWARRLWRGYDQVSLIAERVSVLTGIPVVYGLKKIKRTQSQSAVSGVERAQNCHDAFALTSVGEKLLAGKRVMLIDDVVTTGATLTACARAIAHIKPARIQAFVAARTVQGV